MYGYPYPPQRPVTSGAATGAVICAVLGLCLPPLSLVAIALAFAAYPKTSTGQEGGHGMTMTALILGFLVAIPMILFVGLMATGLMIPDPA